MKSQKGFVNIALIVVLVILVGLVGYFVWYRKADNANNNIVNQPMQSQENENQPVQGKDWTGQACGGGVTGGGIWTTDYGPGVPEGYTCDLTGAEKGGDGKLRKVK